jgi:hypothetical protein
MVTALYLGQIPICLKAKQFPQVAMLGGYVIANLGLIWSVS